MEMLLQEHEILDELFLDAVPVKLTVFFFPSKAVLLHYTNTSQGHRCSESRLTYFTNFSMLTTNCRKGTSKLSKVKIFK